MRDALTTQPPIKTRSTVPLFPPANGVVMVMFSVVYVCHSIQALPPPTCPNLFNLDLTVQLIPQTCSNSFKLDLTVQPVPLPAPGPETHSNFVQCIVRTVGKRAVGFRLKCLYSSCRSVHVIITFFLPPAHCIWKNTQKAKEPEEAVL